MSKVWQSCQWIMESYVPNVLSPRSVWADTGDKVVPCSRIWNGGEGLRKPNKRRSRWQQADDSGVHRCDGLIGEAGQEVQQTNQPGYINKFMWSRINEYFWWHLIKIVTKRFQIIIWFYVTVMPWLSFQGFQGHNFRLQIQLYILRLKRKCTSF